MPTAMPMTEAFGNIVGKGENASNQRFLLFPPHFLSYQRHESSLDLNLNCHLQMFLNGPVQKFCCLVELRVK